MLWILVALLVMALVGRIVNDVGVVGSSSYLLFGVVPTALSLCEEKVELSKEL